MAFTVDSVAHAVAGAVGGMTAMTLLYPLENIRCRLQAQKNEKKQLKEKLSEIREETSSTKQQSTNSHKQDNKPRKSTEQIEQKVEEQLNTHYTSSYDCFQQVVKNDGWTALYSGCTSAVVGVGVSSAVYFFFYASLKQGVLDRTGKKNLDPVKNIVVATVAGVLNVFITMPLWLVNTRMTLSNKKQLGIIDSIRDILKREGPTAFYKGLIPSLILVSNPAIQFVAYEQMVRLIKIRNKRANRSLQLSATEFFTLGAIAKAVATVLTYPYQVVKTKEQAYKGKDLTTYQLIKRIIDQEGISAFFNGIGAKMSQTVTNSALMFLIYEYLVQMTLAVLRKAPDATKALIQSK